MARKFSHWYQYLDPRNLRPKVLLDGSHRAKPCEWKQAGIKYRQIGVRTYQLEQDWWCESGIIGCAAMYELGGHLLGKLTQDGRIELYGGFTWDGPSGPLGFMPGEFDGTVNTKDSMAGSAAHDLLYRLGRMHKLGVDKRDEADALALKIWLQDGMYPWRARVWYRALRKGAGFAFTGKVEDLISSP